MASDENDYTAYYDEGYREGERAAKLPLSLTLLAGYGAYKLWQSRRGSGCPEPTQNIAVNTRNRDIAIKRFDYGPLNPSAPSVAFWRKIAKRFTGGKEPTAAQIVDAKKARCGNCGVFDISPVMLKCMPPVIAPDQYDSFAVESDAVLGYCWAHHFKCASTRTCATWVHGGPIRSDALSPLLRK